MTWFANRLGSNDQYCVQSIVLVAEHVDYVINTACLDRFVCCSLYSCVKI